MRSLLARCMCTGVPIRKHTWNTVSPTQPRHSTSQQCWVYLSGNFSRVSSPIIVSSSSESSNWKSKAASPRARTSGNCLLGGRSLFLRHAMWIQWIHLPYNNHWEYQHDLEFPSYLPSVVKILRNFHPYGVIQLFVVLTNHGLLAEVHQQSL